MPVVSFKNLEWESRLLLWEHDTGQNSATLIWDGGAPIPEGLRLMLRRMDRFAVDGPLPVLTGVREFCSSHEMQSYSSGKLQHPSGSHVSFSDSATSSSQDGSDTKRRTPKRIGRVRQYTTLPKELEIPPSTPPEQSTTSSPDRNREERDAKKDSRHHSPRYHPRSPRPSRAIDTSGRGNVLPPTDTSGSSQASSSGPLETPHTRLRKDHRTQSMKKLHSARKSGGSGGSGSVVPADKLTLEVLFKDYIEGYRDTLVYQEHFQKLTEETRDRLPMWILSMNELTLAMQLANTDRLYPAKQELLMHLRTLMHEVLNRVYTHWEAENKPGEAAIKVAREWFRDAIRLVMKSAGCISGPTEVDALIESTKLISGYFSQDELSMAREACLAVRENLVLVRLLKLMEPSPSTLPEPIIQIATMLTQNEGLKAHFLRLVNDMRLVVRHLSAINDENDARHTEMLTQVKLANELHNGMNPILGYVPLSGILQAVLGEVSSGGFFRSSPRSPRQKAQHYTEAVIVALEVHFGPQASHSHIGLLNSRIDRDCYCSPAFAQDLKSMLSGGKHPFVRDSAEGCADKLIKELVRRIQAEQAMHAHHSSPALSSSLAGSSS